jgi:arabinofuranosyltransferase
VGLPAQGTAKVVGALSAGGVLALVYQLSRSMRPLRAVPALGTWLCASTLVFGGYGVFGLETSFFTLLVLGGVLVFLREERRDVAPALRSTARGGLPWSGVLFGLAGLTRPEAPLYLGLFMLFLGGPALWPAALRRLAHGSPNDERTRMPILAGALACLVGVGVAVVRRQPAPSWLLVAGGIAALVATAALVGAAPRRIVEPRNLLRGAVFVAIVGAHLLWRHAYYGAWVPNTLTAKTGDIGQQIAGGLDYFEKFVRHEGPVIYLVLLGVALALVRRQAALCAAAAIVLVGSVYVVIVGGDWMPLYRFFAPIVPFAFLLIDVGVRAAVERGHRFVNYGLVILAIVTVAQRAGQFDRDAKKVVVDERGFWEKAAGGTARWFTDREQKLGAEQTRGAIAIGDIGQVGWETDYPIFDVLGLVEPVISKLEGGYTRKTGPGYRDRFFEVKPRYFVMISAEGDCAHPSVPTSSALFRDQRFQREYYVAGTVRLGPQHNWCIWERKDFR